MTEPYSSIIRRAIDMYDKHKEALISRRLNEWLIDEINQTYSGDLGFVKITKL